MLRSEAFDEETELNQSSSPLLVMNGSGVGAAVIEPRTVAVPAPSIRRILDRIPNIKKLIRYGSTSAIALVISEITLLVLFANNVVGATSAALLANVAGTVPSYLLARYWIWKNADRRQAGRQVAVYWTISIISMVISSFSTGFISHHTPKERVLHLAVLSGSYLAISMVLWVAKYVVYERLVFKSDVEVAV